MAIGDQLRSLNWRDPGSLPPLVKLMCMLGALVVVLIAAYVSDWSSQLEEFDTGTAIEQTLKQDYKTKKNQSINLIAYERQYKEVDITFGAMLRQLPNRQQVEALLVEINQAGLQRGLQFESFKPGTETLRDFYAELPISIKVTGNYHDIGGFASDLAQLSRIVTLNNLSIVPNSDGTLSLESTARTYRYLDEEEAAAQRKALAAAKAKR